MEDNREELINWKKGPSKTRVILPLFEKRGTEWILSTSHSEQINWTIAFDGRNRGNISSLPSSGRYVSTVRTHVPSGASGVNLSLGKPSEMFSGWENTLFNRPLVLVSNGHCEDPERWKPLQPNDSQKIFFKSAFSTAYPKVLNCDENENVLPNPLPVSVSNIKITSCYRTIKGSSLVNMYLEGCKCGMCEGPFQDQLLYFELDKPAAQLDLTSENGQLSLELVDVGDYDGDSKSEAIFFVSGYDEDGYALFYDCFKKSVLYTWHYH